MPEWLLLIVYCKCQIRFRKDASCIYNLTLFPSSKSQVFMLTQKRTEKPCPWCFTSFWQKAKPGNMGINRLGTWTRTNLAFDLDQNINLKKGIGQPEIIIYWPSCHSKPVWLSLKKEDILRTNNGSQWETKYLYILKNNNKTYLPLSSAGESQSMTEFSFRVNNPFKYIFSKKGAK